MGWAPIDLAEAHYAAADGLGLAPVEQIGRQVAYRLRDSCAGSSEGWSSGLDGFHPTFAAGSCEVTDPNGTPTNVRGGPSARSSVVTTVIVGATLPADDHVGSWFHVRSTPPGWVHAAAVRCTELPRAPEPCP